MARLGNVIRDRRRELGLTQDDLADDIGMTNSYIARIEVGERSPGANTLFKIAEVLQIPFEKLMALSASEHKYAKVKLSDEVDRKLCVLPLKVKLTLLEFASTLENKS